MSDEEWKQFLARLYGGGASGVLPNAIQTAGSGVMDGVGKRGLDTPAERDFLTSLMGSETATDPRTTTDGLAHHLGAGVTYNNASGTDPMMMATAGNAVGAGLNNIGLPTQLQNAVNDQFRINNSNFAGTGEPNMDAVPPNLTQEQYQMWLRMPDHLKDSFIRGIADGSYSPYAMEQQMGY